ncbi:MAG: radical SAM protein [Deltaproteobacteria bacterium]|nr:radical SAM protein [Deltaproteobacteria bacterium]
MATNLARRTRLARLSENLAMLGRYATAARLSNLALNEWEYRRGQTVLRSLPPTLTVDVTNACQLACPLCATGRGDVDRPTRTMPLARFEDLLRQAHERAFQVHLYSWGEPTLVPNLADYVAAVRRRRLGCVFSTNLSRPLKDRKIRDLVAAGPDRIVVSIDGITPETHAQYRVGSDLAVVRDNLARFRSAREARRAAHPMLVWQMLAFRAQSARDRHGGKAASCVGLRPLRARNPEPAFRRHGRVRHTARSMVRDGPELPPRRPGGREGQHPGFVFLAVARGGRRAGR